MVHWCQLRSTVMNAGLTWETTRLLYSTVHMVGVEQHRCRIHATMEMCNCQITYPEERMGKGGHIIHWTSWSLIQFNFSSFKQQHACDKQKMEWSVEMWNGKCDDMREILSASWNEADIELANPLNSCQLIPTHYMTNIKLKRVEQMNGSRIKDMEWIMNDNRPYRSSRGSVQ